MVGHCWQWKDRSGVRNSAEKKRIGKRWDSMRRDGVLWNGMRRVGVGLTDWGRVVVIASFLVNKCLYFVVLCPCK